MIHLLSTKKLIRHYQKPFAGKEIRLIQRPCWKFVICMKLILIWIKMTNLKLEKDRYILIISMIILAFITSPKLMN